MFGRKKPTHEAQGLEAEPRPYGVRIMSLSSEERRQIARHRYEELTKLLKASGCAVLQSPTDYAINFHTGRNLMTVQVNPEDPRQIGLVLMGTIAEGDIHKAERAAHDANIAQFSSRITVSQAGSGYELKVSVGVYAEALHSFGDSLKAYVDDVEGAYEDFVTAVTSDD